MLAIFISFTHGVNAQESVPYNDVLKLVPQTGHRGIIRCAIFSPDHKLIASGGDDGVIILWDAITYEQKAIISGYSLPVVSMAFSPDGKLLATSGSGADLTLWDVKTCSKVINLGKRGNSLQFSSDGSFLVLGSNDYPDKNNIIVWETKTWTIRNRFKSSFDTPIRILLSPDDKLLAVVGSQTSVRDNGIYRGLDVCNVNTGEVIKTIQNIKFEQPMQRMLFEHAVNFSATGEYLIEGIDAKNDEQTRIPRQKINIWNTTTWEQQLLKESNIYYTDIKPIPDNDKLAFMTMNKGVNIWDLKNKNIVSSISSISSKDVVINPYFENAGNKIIAGGQGCIVLFDMISGKKYEGFSEQTGIIKYVDFNSSASGIITRTRFKTETKFLNWHFGIGRPCKQENNFDDNVINLDTDIKLKWNRNGAISIVPFPGRYNASSEFYSKNKYSSGNVVINNDQTMLAAWKEVCDIALFDFSDNFKMDKLSFQQPDVMSSISSNIAKVKISQNNHFIASSGSGNVQLWNIQSKTRIFHFKVPENQTTEFAISPDEKMFAYSTENNLYLYDIYNKQEIITFPMQYICHNIVFSPDNKYIGLMGIYGNYGINIFDINLKKIIKKINIINNLLISPDVLEFTSDSTNILTGDNILSLFNIQTGREIKRFSGHDGRVVSASFSYDNRLLATGSMDGTTRLWNVDSGKLICTLISFADDNWAVIDPLGRYDASNAGDIDGLRWVLGDEIIALRQLKERYYEPGLLAKLLGYNDEPLRPVENIAAIKLFPEISISQPVGDSSSMHVNLTNRGGGIGAIRVLVNGKEMVADVRGSVKPDMTARSVSYKVNLADSSALQRGRENLVEIIASNIDGTLSSRSNAFRYFSSGKAVTRDTELYAVVVGISNYASDKLKLNFASRDADAIAEVLSTGSKRLFGADKVHLYKFTSKTDLQPTKNNLLQAFKDIADKAQTGDILIIYLAGHGAVLPRGNDTYCYLTCDAGELTDIIDPVKREKTAISSDELRLLCNRIPALKQVMILDTCAAGAAAGTLIEKREISGDQIRAIERLKDRTGFHILMGCAGNSRSYETSQFGQGLLTYSLLQGMKGVALREGQFIDVNSLFSYAADKVPALAVGIGGIQHPVISAPKGSSFDIGQLTTYECDKIPCPTAKPLMLRPVLLDIKSTGDPLGLTDLLRNRLHNENGAGWIYIDADTAPDSESIQGTYSVDGNTITLTFKLWKSGKEKQKVIITENILKIDNLIDKIVAMIK